MEKENSSWLRKCGTTHCPSFPSSSSSMDPPPQLNQILDGNFQLYSSIRGKPTSSMHRLAPEAVYPWNTDISPCSLGHTQQGSSFLALLSGPPCINPNEVPLCGSKVSGYTAGCELSHLPSRLLSPNLNSQNVEAGANLDFAVSSKARVSANQGSNFCLNNVLQGASSNIQKLDLHEARIHQRLSCNENQTVSSSTKIGCVNDAVPAAVWNIRSSNTVDVPQKVPVKTDSSVSCHSSVLLTGCPQVFCLGLSGNLLLSSTGLFGVLCSCHGLHMSISKFCEHSGLNNVNPGDAVHMDTGETIAQWRKAYFHSFGVRIRIPADDIGWDWPQGLSVTAGLVKNGLTMHNKSVNSDHFNQGGSFWASVQSVSPWNHELHQKHSQTGQKVSEELFHCEEQQSTPDNRSLLFKGSSSSSKNSLHSLADNQMKVYSRSECPTMPNLAGVRGPYNIYESISSYKNPIAKSGNSVCPPYLQSLNVIGNDIATRSSVGSLVDIDTISSNVELRLGQPSHQSLISGNSIMPASGSPLVITHGQPHKLSVLDQHVHKTGSSRSIEGSREHINSAGTMSNSSTRREQSQLTNMNHVHRVYSVPNASEIKLPKGSTARFSVTSESLVNLRSPCEEKNCCKSINNVINVSHVMASNVHSETFPNKSGQFGFPLLRGEVIGKNFSTSVPDSQKYQKVNEVGCTSDGLHGTAELDVGPQTKSKGMMWHSHGVSGDGDHTNYSVLHDKVPKMCQFGGTMANETDSRNTFNYFGQASIPVSRGQYESNLSGSDSNLFRTVSSPMDLGAILTSQAVSTGISASNSVPIESTTPSSSKEDIGEKQYFLDDDLKIIAFQSISAISNQNLVTGTSKTIPDPEVFRNNSGKAQFVVPPLVSEMQKKGFNFGSVPNATETATGSLLSANLTFRDNRRLSFVTGSSANEKLNHSDSDTYKRCYFPVPAVTQGWFCHDKDTDNPCQLSSGQQPRGQFFLRFDGNESYISPSSVAENCYQELSNRCVQSQFSCTRNSNYLAGKCDLVGRTSIGEFRKQKGNAVDLVAPFSGPKLDKYHISAEKDDSFCQNINMVKNMKKTECNSFQWRDVPRKVVTDAIEAATRCSEKSAHHEMKEQENSNMSSGCSAPAVTQVSIEANIKDSTTIDSVDAENLVDDEGSAIERCWSSDDESERSAEFSGFTSKSNLVDERSSKTSLSKPSHGLIDELRFRGSSRIRRMKNQTDIRFPIHPSSNLLQKYERDPIKGKRRTMKWKRLYSSVSTSALPAPLNGSPEYSDDAGRSIFNVKTMQMLPQGDKQNLSGYPCSLGQNLKRKRSAFSSFDAVSRKRDLRAIHRSEVEITDSETNLTAKRGSFKASEVMEKKQSRLVGATQGLEQDDVHDSTCIISDISDKVTAVKCTTTSSKQVNVCHRRRRPIVCGKYGIISNADLSRPAKIVSLRTVLKESKRCSFAESGKVEFVPVKASKYSRCTATKKIKNDVHDVVSTELHSQHLVEGKETACSLGSKDSCDTSYILRKRRYGGSKSHGIADRVLSTQLRRKSKEVRKRSIYELTIKEKDSSHTTSSTMKNGRSLLRTKSRCVSNLVHDAGDNRMSSDETFTDNGSTKESCRNSQDLDVFCCVCGSSNKDECNSLLECSCCLIKVHQACYGVSKVPKAQWYCRPCKTNSKNVVCVLCGYGGGAMTRALHSHNIVKSLLKAWSTATKSNSENPQYSKSLESPFKMLPSSNSDSDPFLIIRPALMESTSVAMWSTDLSEHVDTINSPSSVPSAPVLNNSITAGVLDSTVKQWVHMVCGLWTPTTRCPNVHTMGAFDVSGACWSTQHVVCSICRRPGGSCIQCRVADCDVQFHPWCAHQKGLLQSEVEGTDNESVGFYGRCMIHAMCQYFDTGGYRSSNADHAERELTCARTEGYKGRKQDGFHHNLIYQSDGNSGCLVPQEQLNAWIHINGQKSCTRGPLKLPTSVIEYDCRKEYARYKQSRGWKHLVVYKSGIHGLGLYTSQFISRGAMVVEYVGEIVGLHVADKRETEYQAGKKLQYKGACYFFRIDKELIIDATRKGGIARFVNHSCLPNCVAKVISVKNEKKVIFFAERDIYPGEEITYDYHFNYEDEGKKIPCYCKSKNCRRYLN